MGEDATPLTILVAALGGQGGGVLAEWLVEAASAAGFVAQSTSIPGVAQRTGATTYYVEIHPVPRNRLGGRRPVLSLQPVPGGVDLFVASELLEAGRTIAAGYTSAERTTLVASTSRTLTTAEKMALGDGAFASDRLLAVARSHSRRLVAFDMDDAARRAGTVVSAVMFGAIAGTGLLPFGRDACEAVIRASGVGVEASLRGFARGHDAVVAEAHAVEGTYATGPTPTVARIASASDEPSGADVPAGPAAALSDWPPAVRDIVALGHARLVDYQDARYASLYLDRVRRVMAAERDGDPREGHALATTREAARFLALWMAFDDVVRVAALKVRASRFARIRDEVRAADRDVVRIVDHFKPGVPELAGLLPPALAHRLMAWDRRRQAAGRAPWALALHVRADGVAGFAALRTMAAMKRFRPRGARWAEEQQAIERWLDAVVRHARRDWRAGYELALAGRLIKGYGETNARGKRNLAHILDTLAGGTAFGGDAARADAIAKAREAALADEGGRALDAVLAAHGAPPRPVRAQPIVFMKRPAQRPDSRAA